MTCDIGSSISSIYTGGFSASSMNSAFANPFTTTIIMTIFILVLLTILYPCKPGVSFNALFKFMVYVAIGSLIIITIHGGVIRHTCKANYEDKKTMELFDRVINSDNSIPNLISGDNDIAVPRSSDEDIMSMNE